MLDENRFGIRDKRGNWKPFKLTEPAPIFQLPLNFTRIFKWIFGIYGYIFPWNFFYGVMAVILWLYFTPSLFQSRSNTLFLP